MKFLFLLRTKDLDCQKNRWEVVVVAESYPQYHKCAALAEAHQFEPIAVETMGVYGWSTGVILRAIGCRLVEATWEPREANWFRQYLAIAVQRGNAFSFLSVGRESGSGKKSALFPEPGRGCDPTNILFLPRCRPRPDIWSDPDLARFILSIWIITS